MSMPSVCSLMVRCTLKNVFLSSVTDSWVTNSPVRRCPCEQREVNAVTVESEVTGILPVYIGADFRGTFAGTTMIRAPSRQALPFPGFPFASVAVPHLFHLQSMQVVSLWGSFASGWGDA